MLYVRGQPLDYDTWGQLGNRGWSYSQILPYFKKSEHFERDGDDSRGKGGPLNVADMSETPRAVRRLHRCRRGERLPEEQGLQQRRPGRLRLLPGDDEERQTPVDGARLPRSGPQPAQPPDRDRCAGAATSSSRASAAVGVAYSVHGQTREARVNREVIVSCGSVQSPGVLEHSGIGQPELLRNARHRR